MAVSRPDSLAFMTKLSHAVFLSRPPTQDTSGTPQPTRQPTLILLLGWVEARHTHLAKYVHQYRALCPNATIILVTSRLQIMALPHLAPQDVEPAVAALRAALDDNDDNTTPSPPNPATPKLHIHLFSNGGSCLLSEIRKSYALTAPADHPPNLPLHTTIFDSAPSTHFSRSIIAESIILSLPTGLIRTLLTPLTHLCTLWFMLQIYLPGGFDPYARRGAEHNDAGKVRETQRVYIYSDIDPLIPIGEVENHADEAEKRGFAVRRELFAKSPHVSHARSDEQRYWGIVREVLDGKGASKSEPRV